MLNYFTSRREFLAAASAGAFSCWLTPHSADIKGEVKISVNGQEETRVVHYRSQGTAATYSVTDLEGNMLEEILDSEDDLDLTENFSYVKIYHRNENTTEFFELTEDGYFKHTDKTRRTYDSKSTPWVEQTVRDQLTAAQDRIKIYRPELLKQERAA